MAALEEDRDMALPSSEITIPNVRLDLEDLLLVILGLDGPARARMAHVLAESESEMDAGFKDLVTHMDAWPAAEDATDADVDREVSATESLCSRSVRASAK
jgi:hypothetical protein